GILMSEAMYRNGQQSGYFRTYYANSQLDTESTTEGGKRIGSFKQYSPEGVLMVEGQYLEGLLQGRNRAWYEDGQIRHIFQYEKGKKIGTNWTFYPDSIVESRQQLTKDGKLQEEVYWPSGKRKALKSYVGEQPSGNWTYYDEQGTL